MTKKIQFYASDDIRAKEAEIPVPGTGEIVIKNEITLTCGTDMKTYKHGHHYEPPFGMGHETSSVIYAIGEGATGFKISDRVVAHSSTSCGICYYCKKGQGSMCVDLIQNQFINGAYAECQLVPERIVKLNTFHIPEGMSYKQIALLGPLAYALCGTETTSFDLGSYVCINDCGSIGLMFIRMCILRGTHVIAYDMTSEKLALAKRLDAQGIINAEDLNGRDQAETMKEPTPGTRGVDAATEAAGLPEVWQTALRMVGPDGEVLFFDDTRKDPGVPVDTTLVHYSQLTSKGMFHTTPQHINTTFEMLRMGAISVEDLIQNEYCIGDTKKAIIEHAGDKVIKNYIVYK